MRVLWRWLHKLGFYPPPKDVSTVEEAEQNDRLSLREFAIYEITARTSDALEIIRGFLRKIFSMCTEYDFFYFSCSFMKDSLRKLLSLRLHISL